MVPANCLVMFRKGTTMLMLKARPEMLMLGAPLSSSAPPTSATTTYSHVADVAQHGHQDVGIAVGRCGR